MVAKEGLESKENVTKVDYKKLFRITFAKLQQSQLLKNERTLKPYFCYTSTFCRRISTKSKVLTVKGKCFGFPFVRQLETQNCSWLRGMGTYGEVTRGDL